MNTEWSENIFEEILTFVYYEASFNFMINEQTLTSVKYVRKKPACMNY